MTTCDDARAELDRAVARRDSEHGVLSDLKSTLSRLTSDHSSLKTAFDRLSSELVNLDSTIVRLESERTTAQQAVPGAEAELVTMKDLRDRVAAGEKLDLYGEENRSGYRELMVDRATDARDAARAAFEQATKTRDTAVQTRERQQSEFDRRAAEMYANEQAQTTAENKISISEGELGTAETWVTSAQQTYDEVC